MTIITIAVDHIKGDNKTKVPKISRYRFLSLNKRNKRNGRSITTAVSQGRRSNNSDPNKASKVTDKSKKFHPEDMYSDQPSPTIFNSASSKNTKIKNNIY